MELQHRKLSEIMLMVRPHLRPSDPSTGEIETDLLLADSCCWPTAVSDRQSDPRPADIASRIAGPAIGHFERNGRKKFGEPSKTGLLQNGPAHWRPKPWGQHLGTRAQPGGMSSRPRGPLPSNARGEKSVTQNGRFSAASGEQFRSLADRWRFSATGHAGPASCKVSAGAYQFCAATLCRV